MKNQYIVHYVLDCTPTFKIFTSKEAAVGFFDKMNEHEDRTGNWADFVIKGELIVANGHYANKKPKGKKK